MTTGSFVGMLGMLGLVLALLVITLRILKRYTPLGDHNGSTVPLKVLQRMAVGPRQGIAIVRIGNQQMMVSVGDGGVRLIADVTATVAEFEQVPNTVTSELATATPVETFRRLLGSALRLSVVLAVLLAGHSITAMAQGSAGKASATQAAPTPNTKPNTKPAVTVAPTPAPVARVDTMISRLAPKLDLRVGDDKSGGLHLSGTVGIVVMLGLLTLLPTLVLMMTGFTRILIVLHFLRQAIGSQTAPPAQLIAALALLLTGFVMAPTLVEVNRTALEPWMDGKIAQTQMLAEGIKPFRTFMLRQVRDRDLSMFMNLSRLEPAVTRQDVPTIVLVSAFVTSELRTSFQIGFALFLPFIVIDVVVASVLMSMGMMMLPPTMISLPFKLLLFVLVDGWSLVAQGLIQSFH